MNKSPFTWFHWEARPLARFGTVAFITASLLVSNLFFYIPARMSGMKGLYNVSRACYQPFETAKARANTPALVIVHVQDEWIEYGCIVDMSSPFMDSDFVITISRGEELDNTVTQRCQTGKYCTIIRTHKVCKNHNGISTRGKIHDTV